MLLEKKKFDVKYFYKGVDEDLGENRHIIGIRDDGGDKEESYEYIETLEDLWTIINIQMDYNTSLEIVEAKNVVDCPFETGFFIY